MEKLAELSANRLVKAIKKKQISSLVLLEFYIERYKRLNSGINAIIGTGFKNARKRARAADAATAKGDSWGPLHGLPMTGKDKIEVVGMPTTNGNPQFKDFMPFKNADVVQALLDAGAIIFGKTNLPLGAMDTQTFNKLFGQTNNPWNSLSLVAYLPATIAPVGFTTDGLPVGVQIIGHYLEDLTPIQFAMLLEKK